MNQDRKPTDPAPLGQPVPPRVLFLDIDGVLNSTRTEVAFNGSPRGFAPAEVAQMDAVALGLVRGLCRAANVSIVLSSSWRVTHGWDEVGRALDLPIFDRTPSLPDCRGAEIARWLADHPGVEAWAILDDNPDMLRSQRWRFVRVDGAEGLSWVNFLELCDLFDVNPHECTGTRMRVVAGRVLDWSD